jgi:hypothetical protein
VQARAGTAECGPHCCIAGSAVRPVVARHEHVERAHFRRQRRHHLRRIAMAIHQRTTHRFVERAKAVGHERSARVPRALECWVHHEQRHHSAPLGRRRLQRGQVGQAQVAPEPHHRGAAGN